MSIHIRYNWRFQVDGEPGTCQEMRRYHDEFFFQGTHDEARAEADRLAEQFGCDTGLEVARVHLERCGLAAGL